MISCIVRFFSRLVRIHFFHILLSPLGIRPPCGPQPSLSHGQYLLCSPGGGLVGGWTPRGLKKAMWAGSQPAFLHTPVHSVPDPKIQQESAVVSWQTVLTGWIFVVNHSNLFPLTGNPGRHLIDTKNTGTLYPSVSSTCSLHRQRKNTPIYCIQLVPNFSLTPRREVNVPIKRTAGSATTNENHSRIHIVGGS